MKYAIEWLKSEDSTGVFLIWFIRVGTLIVLYRGILWAWGLGTNLFARQKKDE